MTVQDLLDWCKNAKAPTHPDGYPLSATLLLYVDGKDFELQIDGVEGHGHEWEEPERILLTIKKGKNEH